MQIWVPYANLRANLRVLADEHVFDVIYVGLDTLRYLHGKGGAGGKIAQRWRSGSGFLLGYVMLADVEARRRGHQAEPAVAGYWQGLYRHGHEHGRPPHWFGDPLIHESHRSNLIRINPEYYARRFPMTTRLELRYYWPDKKG